MINYLSFMYKRFLVLAAFVLTVGIATHAFAQNQQFDPNSAISRAGAVAVLVESKPALKERLAFHIKHPSPIPLFDDVDYSQWYAPYIETAFEAGIITGNDERMFRPGDTLTEEEAIALGIRYHAIAHPEIVMQLLAGEGSWFNVMVSSSVQSGLDLPFPIRLGQPMKRGDWYALMTSMSIQNPENIAVSNQVVAPQRPVVTANVIKPITNRPTTTVTATQPRPTQTTTTSTQQTTSRAPITTAQTPPPAAPTPSAKPFSISMPTLGIKDLTITHPTDPFTKDGLHSVLKNGVGHLFSYPGKGGKILVYGHSSSYPWDVSQFTKIFRQINKLNVGDRIEVTYNGTVYTYEVSKKQTVLAEDMSVYQQQGGGEELILYTCWPPDSIKERYLVHAKPVQAVAVNR